MTAIAILIALASLGVSGFTFHKNKTLVRALEAEKAEKAELTQTLVHVLDEDYNIRGQLALPGQPVAKKVSDRLAIAEKSVSTIQDEIREQTKKLKAEVTQASGDLGKARDELVEALGREKKATKTLAEVVDGDGKVLAQLRLPGSKKKGQKPPITTPCGDMCKLAFWKDGKKDYHGRLVGRGWKCTAGQGSPCDDVRSKFVDSDGQCVLFERDNDC